MQKTNKTTIVFDLGRVLLDWDPHYLYCDAMGLERRQVERFFQEVDFFAWNTKQDSGRPFAEATAELSARFPAYRELIEAYDERYLDTVGGQIDETVDILYRLKEAGFPLYALSNWSAEKFALVRPHYPFLTCFDDLIISGEVGLVKPGREIFDLLLQRAGCTAGECLFIDDSTVNIDAAAALGFQTVLFRSPQQLETELLQWALLDHGVQ